MAMMAQIAFGMSAEAFLCWLWGGVNSRIAHRIKPRAQRGGTGGEGGGGSGAGDGPA